MPTSSPFRVEPHGLFHVSTDSYHVPLEQDRLEQVAEGAVEVLRRDARRVAADRVGRRHPPLKRATIPSVA